MQILWNSFPAEMGESRNMIAGLYDLEETIGEGHYAVVKLARYDIESDHNSIFVSQACVHWGEGGCESD